MMGATARAVARELRGSTGRAVFITGALAVGVAAVVAVAGLAAALEAGLRREARQLLAADLSVSAGRPLPTEVFESLAAWPGTRTSEVRELATMAAIEEGPSRLVEVKAVESGYPLYGRVLTDPPGDLAELLGDDRVVVAPGLLTSLGLVPGDELRLGHGRFTVAGVVEREGDRVSSLVRGPRVFLSLAGLERSGLEGELSRIQHRVLVRLPGDQDGPAVAAAAARISHALREFPGIRVESFVDAQPNVRQGLRRAERFLGLVALLSLLVSAVGVAQAVRAWVAGRMDAIAVRRCLGARPREVFALYAGQTALLALAGSLAGGLVGLAVQAWVPPLLLGDLIPVDALSFWQPAALARGLALGVAVAVLLALPALTAVLRIPPLRVMRREAEPLPVDRRMSAAMLTLAAGGTWAAATTQAGSWLVGGAFLAGLVGLVVTAALAARGLARLAAAWPDRARRYWLRHGLAAVIRPAADTIGAVVALAVGAAAVLTMHLVESHLSRDLVSGVTADAPSAFLLDIQPQQWPGLQKMLAAEGVTRVDTQPLVTARLLGVDGRGVREMAAVDGDQGRRRWALTREQRLTYGPELPADNRVVAGRLWPPAGGVKEVSIEREFAAELGATVGSLLRFDIQGVPLELVVGSIRTVEWRSFGINFFLHVAPGVLEQAPQQRLAMVHLPPGREQFLQDRIVANYPNVTVIQIREVLERVAGVLAKAAAGVRFLGWFTVLAGVAILGGAVSAGEARRGREVAVLKTLGMTRGGVVTIFAVEYALLGTVAGTVGATGGVGLAWLVVTRVMDLSWRAPVGIAVLTVVALAMLVVAAGVATSVRSLARPPAAVLRSE